MDYLRGIAVLLCCCGVFFSLSNGQSLGVESPISRKNNNGNRYAVHYDPIEERYKDDIPRNKPFHDIFSVKSLTGETERVHYAVDDHGIRTNIHTNAVKFGPKIDTGAISFGSRFTGWPSDNFDSMFLSVPQLNVQTPPPHSNNGKVVPVPSLEITPAFVPLRNTLSPSSPQPLNLKPDINVNIQTPEEQVPSSDIPEPVQPFYPAELEYEPQRISKPFFPNPVSPTGNLPIAGHAAADREENFVPQNSALFKSESEAIFKESKSLPSLPEFVPQLPNLNYIQQQYANNKNLKWYQSLPQMPPATHSMYSAPFYPMNNKYESQRNIKTGQSEFTSSKKTFQNPPNPTDIANIYAQEAALPKLKEFGMVKETEAIEPFPNINEYVRSQKTSSSPEKSQVSTVIPESQNQKTNTNIQQYAEVLKLSRQNGNYPGTIVPQPQNKEINLNSNKYVEYPKPSNFPLSNIESTSNFEPQKEGINSNNNQYIGSQKLYDAPEQLSSTNPFEPQKQLINPNQHAASVKLSNFPILSADSKFGSPPKFPAVISNANKLVVSQKDASQSYKEQNTFSDQIKRNKPTFNKEIAASFPKNIFPATKQPTVLTSTQNKEQQTFKSKLAPLIRKNAQFLLSKSLVSSPMSTIFDTSNDNGQYYHYVMNVGKKSGNIAPSRTMVSTRNLFKLLNDTSIRKLNDNKKASQNVINLNNSKILNESDKPNLMLEKLERNINKNFGSSSKSDLDVSGDVIDTTEIFEDIPEVTILDKTRDENGNKQVLDKMIDEITSIINTEEPQTSSERISQSFGLNITSQPTTEQTTSSFPEHLFEINTTPKELPTEYNSMKPTMEQTTSSFLESLFHLNTTPEELPTEYTIIEGTKSVSGGDIADQNTELASLFITQPENSLTSLFYDDDIEGNSVGFLKIKPSDEFSLFNKDNTSSEFNSEIKATTDSRDSEESTPTTGISFDSSTITKSPVTVTESSTLVSTSSETTSTESLSTEINKDLEGTTPSTTNSIPSTLTPSGNTDLSTIFKETLNEKSESNTEQPTSTIPSSSILIDIVNTGSTTNKEIIDLNDSPTTSSEQPKPMLELVIQNTEMNDFMSRINNMPIMIRVLNPLTTTTQVPDVGREISTIEGNHSINFSTIVSINENVDVSSTEPTTLTYLNIDYNGINVTDISGEKTLDSGDQTLSYIQSNNKAAVEETLITEPNLKDTVILTTLKPQDTKSTLDVVINTDTEIASDTTVSWTTPIPESKESSTAMLLDFQPPEALQYTLIKPGNSEFPDSSLLSTSQFQSFSDYANKLENTAQNYNTNEPIAVHEDWLAVSVEPYTAISLTNDDEPLPPMFIDSDQVHASEESQKIANFKSVNSINNNLEPQKSATRPVNFHSPSQPIIIKNSTVIQYQDISNYKGYDRHPPVQYVDLVPFKDIDYDSHLPLGNEEKFPSDAIFVFDDYDVFPSNSDDQNNEYVLIENNGNYEGNVLPANVLSPNDFDSQHLFVLDSNSQKFGTRFQQETSKEKESQQEKLSDSQQHVQLNFETFRPQRNFESDNDFRKEPWFPSQQ